VTSPIKKLDFNTRNTFDGFKQQIEYSGYESSLAEIKSKIEDLNARLKMPELQ
jgi:hypothetical protein